MIDIHIFFTLALTFHIAQLWCEEQSSTCAWWIHIHTSVVIWETPIWLPDYKCFIYMCITIVNIPGDLLNFIFWTFCLYILLSRWPACNTPSYHKGENALILSHLTACIIYITNDFISVPLKLRQRDHHECLTLQTMGKLSGFALHTVYSNRAMHKTFYCYPLF